MALLSSRRRAPQCAWRPDGQGVWPGGDIGGDIQRGASWTVRFVRDDMPGSLITVSFYAVEYPENPGEFDVQRQVEWMVCGDPSDPGGTEVWSETEYDDVSALVIHSAGEAQREAREWAEYVLADTGCYDGWDGQPFAREEAM